VLQAETWSLSGGVHHWLKRSTRETRKPVTRDDDDDDNNNSYSDIWQACNILHRIISDFVHNYIYKFVNVFIIRHWIHPVLKEQRYYQEHHLVLGVTHRPTLTLLASTLDVF
jgi:hypothetical protein